MSIIFVITALVLGVSLYDYYTSRSWQQVTSASRNDVVFEDRNRSYGAYQIRKDYNRNLIVIMLCISGSIGITYGINRYINGNGNDLDAASGIDYTQFTMEIPPVEAEIVPPPPAEPIPPLEKTIQFVPPVVTDDLVDNKLPPQDLFEDTNAGKENQKGDDENFKPPVDKEVKTSAVQKPDETHTFVDISAEFPGGYTEMAKYIAKNIKYPQEAIELGVEGKSYLRFVVGNDGAIEDVRVVRGIAQSPAMDKEAMRVVKSMPKWKPGEINGKQVRSYFDLPVSFKLN
ncbi:MAG: TonB family protein [Bacteroidota bacterium]